MKESGKINKLGIDKKKTKLIIKRAIQIIIILNIILYSVFYQRYVSTAPDTHKEARINMVNALMIHNIYFLALKIGIDFQNPILQPIVKLRDIFYKKGLNALPENDAERAIWFHQFEEVPYNLSSGGYYGSIIKDYGKTFSDKFLKDIFTYIILLADNEIVDKNFKDKIYLSQAFFKLNQVFIADYKAVPSEPNYSNNNIIAFTQRKDIYDKFFLLYEKRKRFIEKYKETQHLKNTLSKQYYYEDDYRAYNHNNIILNTFLLFYGFKNKTITNCQSAKKYFKEIFIAKDNLRKYMKELKLSKRYRQFEEKFFFKLKIQNTMYDSSKTANPLRIIVHCNYNDIFIQNGN